jgi:RNA polymerase sigma factor (sigma-70 family)
MTREEYSAAYGHGFNLTVRLLLSRGLSPEDAYENAQAAWAKGWERRGQLRKPEMVVTWVNTIALNGYRSSMRGQPRFEELTEHPHPDEQNLAAIDARTLLECCRKNDRIVLEKHYIEGLKVQEIAQQYGWTETAVRIRLLRARRNLRKKLEKQGVTPAVLQGETVETQEEPRLKIVARGRRKAGAVRELQTAA